MMAMMMEAKALPTLLVDVEGAPSSFCHCLYLRVTLDQVSCCCPHCPSVVHFDDAADSCGIAGGIAAHQDDERQDDAEDGVDVCAMEMLLHDDDVNSAAQLSVACMDENDDGYEDTDDACLDGKVDHDRVPCPVVEVVEDSFHGMVAS
jgi:hypothetical protein